MTDYIKDAILSGILETFEMTLFASLFSYIVGLPLGVILYSTSKGRLLENRVVNGFIGFIVNVTRSLPFLILLVLLIPFTRFVVGSSIGTVASIVPLTVGAIPIVARMVESGQSGNNRSSHINGSISFIYDSSFHHSRSDSFTASGRCDQCRYSIRLLGNGRRNRRRRTRCHSTSVRLLPLPEGCALDDSRTSHSHGNAHTGDRYQAVQEDKKDIRGK